MERAGEQAVALIAELLNAATDEDAVADAAEPLEELLTNHNDE